ncbi:MAG: hypothetical protein M0Z95_21120 [Actinomycetota bacterium]|nr:hypothetical protein [Actinomycetota bacterium]
MHNVRLALSFEDQEAEDARRSATGLGPRRRRRRRHHDEQAAPEQVATDPIGQTPG